MKYFENRKESMKNINFTAEKENLKARKVGNNYESTLVQNSGGHRWGAGLSHILQKDSLSRALQKIAYKYREKKCTTALLSF